LPNAVAAVAAAADSAVVVAADSVVAMPWVGEVSVEVDFREATAAPTVADTVVMAADSVVAMAADSVVAMGADTVAMAADFMVAATTAALGVAFMGAAFTAEVGTVVVIGRIISATDTRLGMVGASATGRHMDGPITAPIITIRKTITDIRTARTIPTRIQFRPHPKYSRQCLQRRPRVKLRSLRLPTPGMANGIVLVRPEHSELNGPILGTAAAHTSAVPRLT
jgi:hypothetical protein